MYKCQFRPCPYESKRESNCKQHMEKAHGWAYVRSKNNGKTNPTSRKASKASPSGVSPITPQVTPGSNAYDFSGSEYGGEPDSPYARTHSRATSTTAASINELSPYMAVDHNLEQNFNAPPFDPGFNWEQPGTRLTPVSPFTPNSHGLSMGSGSLENASTLPSSSYGTSMEEIDPPLFNGTFDWSNMDLNTDFTSMNVQLSTPATSIETRPLDTYGNSRNPSISLDQPTKNPNLSPGAEGGVMLYSPHEQPLFNMDEGFEEFADISKPTGDFALFDSEPIHQGSMNLFADLPPFHATAWNSQSASQGFTLEDRMVEGS